MLTYFLSFYFVFPFLQFEYDMSRCGFSLVLILLSVLGVPWICGLLSLILGSLQPLLHLTSFSSILLFFSFWYSNQA